MLLGAKLPDFGAMALDLPPAVSARRAEDAGFDSVWVSDHVVMIRDAASRYPYSSDGAITWDPAEPRLDALIAMAMAATATDQVEIGVAVLIAAMRNPVVLAKQLATIDALSIGRVVLGVGAGWLAEEFEALNVPFSTRGARLDTWIDIMRACWTGEPTAVESNHYSLRKGVVSYPTPAREMPILVGGMSQAALRRAGEKANGWLAFQNAESADVAGLRASVDTLRKHADLVGSEAEPRVVIRITGALGLVASQLRGLASSGISEVIVEVDWLADEGPRRTVERLRNAV